NVSAISNRIFSSFADISVAGLRLAEVRIPKYVIKGSAAQLECLYDLDGEALYSVKWYKDGNEFYRYVPRDMPPAQTFLLSGVVVDLHNSSDAIVALRNVNLQSAGRYRCEVSGEAPSFQTVTEHGDMVVVSLPDQGPPKISGGRPRYQIGDYVRINCTAGRSKPAVELSWFVNGEIAEPQKLRKYDTIVSGREGLETSVLGLQFRVEQKHFRNGDMKLKCVASLSTLYWRSNEESVEGDRPQKAPVLESRETVFASNSRADPVQGTSYRELFVTKILSLFVHPNAASSASPSPSGPTTLALLMVALAVAVASVAGPAGGRRQDDDAMDGMMGGAVARIAEGGDVLPQASELLASRKEENQRASCGKSATQSGKIAVATR
ncbi:hypothetical protein KR026_004211, partial [Drosophila bipectinata]